MTTEQSKAELLTLLKAAVSPDSPAILIAADPPLLWVFWSEYLRQPQTTFEVKTLIGKNLRISADPEDTIDRVKSRVMEIEGIPVDQQRLIFAGRQLQDSQTVGSAQIAEGSVVHLVLRLIGRCNFQKPSHEPAPTSVTTKKRLTKEVSILSSEGLMARQWDGSRNVFCRLDGRPGTPWEGGVFVVWIQVPIDYPFKPPLLCFEEPCMIHPFVRNQIIGAPCRMTHEGWSPAITLHALLRKLSEHLFERSIEQMARDKESVHPDSQHLWMPGRLQSTIEKAREQTRLCKEVYESDVHPERGEQTIETTTPAPQTTPK